jgi:hypothetical protein
MKPNKRPRGVGRVVILFHNSQGRPQTGRVSVQHRKPFIEWLELGFLLVLTSSTLVSVLLAIGAAGNI